jgi:hypothetical protein
MMQGDHLDVNFTEHLQSSINTSEGQNHFHAQNERNMVKKEATFK